MRQQGSLGPFQSSQGVVVLADGLVFLDLGGRQAALGFEKEVRDGGLARGEFTEACLDAAGIGLALGPAGFDQLVPLGQFLVLLRQRAFDPFLLVLQEVIPLGQGQATGANRGVFQPETEGHVEREADGPVVEMVAGQAAEGVARAR